MVTTVYINSKIFGLSILMMELGEMEYIPTTVVTIISFIRDRFHITIQ